MNHSRIFGFFAFIIILASAPVLAQQIEIVVGKQPQTIIFDEAPELFHIFCNGVDKDYDRVFDPVDGDVPASWWVINQHDLQNPHQVYEFRDEGFFDILFRPAVDLQNRRVFINHLNKITSYNIDNFQKIEDVFDTTATALSYEDGLLFISTKINNDDPGTVIVYDLNLKTILYTINAGVNVQETGFFETFDGKNGIAILNVGPYGSDQSSLQIGIYDHEGYVENYSLILGNTANHLNNRNRTAAVTMNGSHTVQMVDLGDGIIDKTIGTGTSGSNGPRESLFLNDDMLLVTTYNADFRTIDVRTGALVSTISTHGKAEGMALNGDSTVLLVANISLPNYSPDSVVTAFYNPTHVEERQQSLKAAVYPNPAEDYFTIKAETQSPSAFCRIRISNLMCQSVFLKELNEIENNTIMLSAKEIGLAAGFYIIEIRYSSSVFTAPLLISE